MEFDREKKIKYKEYYYVIRISLKLESVNLYLVV